MNWLQIILRFVHIGAGATWVGMMTFATFFLAPALGDVGPEGGKVMAALPVWQTDSGPRTDRSIPPGSGT